MRKGLSNLQESSAGLLLKYRDTECPIQQGARSGNPDEAYNGARLHSSILLRYPLAYAR